MKTKSLGLLIVASLAYYFASASWLGVFSESVGASLRSVPDSREYLEVADWIYAGLPSQMIQRRPFFYPLVAGVIQWLSGDWGLWLAQVLCWLISACLFVVNVKKWVVSPVARIGIGALFYFSLTPILLTFLAIPESLALLLFSLMSWTVCKMDEFPKPVYFSATILTLGSILAVTKVNYLPMFFAMIGLMILGQVRGRWALSGRTMTALILVAIAPWVVQTQLARAARAVSSVATTGNDALKLDLYSQVQAAVLNREYLEVREEQAQRNIEMPPMVAFLAHHPALTLHFIFKNLGENIRLVFHLTDNVKPMDHWLRRRLNDFIYWIHLAFILPLGYALWRARGLKSNLDYQLYFMAIIFVMVFLPTAVTHWAADRWAATLIGVWPILYLLVIRKLDQIAWVRVLASRFVSPPKSKLREA